MNILVEAAGTDYPHSDDYVLDRPKGYGNRFVFIFVLTPCVIRDVSGIRKATDGEAIVYAPGFPQYNRADGTPLRNHWLHLYGTGCRKLLKDSGLPVNTVFTPGERNGIAPALLEMRQELFQNREYKNEILEGLARNFVFRLARSGREREKLVRAGSQIAHLEIFCNLRGLMLAAYAEDWTVDRMAREVSLSRSRFCHLYKLFFGISPLSDLLNCRLEEAQKLLRTTHLTVEAVAQRCGFAGAIQFHRLFRKRFGASPRQACPSEIPYIDPQRGRFTPYNREHEDLLK